MNSTIGTVYLRAADVEKLSAFYQEQIGLQVNRSEGDTVYLGAGGRDLLALLPMPHGKRYRGGTGLYHFALLVPSRFDLAMVLKHFAETRTPLQGMSDHLVSEAIYLADPEGNGIEIYRDRPREDWYQNGQFVMDTVALDVNDLLSELTGRDTTWKGIASGTVMGHMHLHVGSIRQAEEFYTQVLGMDIMISIGSASFLSYDGYHHHLGVNIWAGSQRPPADALGLDHWDLHIHDPQVFARIEQQALISDQGVLQMQDPFGNRVYVHAAFERITT